jgi:hypothetical protein
VSTALALRLGYDQRGTNPMCQSSTVGPTRSDLRGVAGFQLIPASSPAATMADLAGWALYSIFNKKIQP